MNQEKEHEKSEERKELQEGSPRRGFSQVPGGALESEARPLDQVFLQS